MRRRIFAREFLWPGVASTMFFSIGYFLLLNGHPHEDAYILFTYVKNLIHGFGISYFPGGTPAEGATDFLWLVAIALISKTGLDIAVAALILNSLGAALMCWTILSALEFDDRDALLSIVGPVVCLAVVLSPPAAASLGGFSTLLYSATIVFLFHVQYTWESERLWTIPWIGLTLGLFRPDGALVGVSAALLATYQVSGRQRNRYLLNVVAAALLAALYFYWRYRYFGLLWPLPLYVKTASGGTLPGAGPTRDWVMSIANFLPFVALQVFFSNTLPRLLIAGIPILMLITGYLFISQSQNISFRFQNASFGILLLLFSLSVCYLGKRVPPHSRSSLIILLFMIPVIHDGVREIRRAASNLTNSDYINFFPQLLRDATTDDTVTALTEAGRFAFWTRGKKIDLVGLNTPAIAQSGLSTFRLDEVEPDVIFLHHAKTLNLGSCTPGFAERTVEEVKAARSALSTNWREQPDPVVRAPGAAVEYLVARERAYTLYSVCYKGAYYHLYAVKTRGTVPQDAFLHALILSHDKSIRLSYIESEKLK